MRAAIHARVSTLDQEPENQLAELRRYAEARSWTIAEYVDKGVSGAKDRRPALDAMIADAKRRQFDVLACYRDADRQPLLGIAGHGYILGPPRLTLALVLHLKSWLPLLQAA